MDVSVGFMIITNTQNHRHLNVILSCAGNSKIVVVVVVVVETYTDVCFSLMDCFNPEFTVLLSELRLAVRMINYRLVFMFELN